MAVVTAVLTGGLAKSWKGYWSRQSAIGLEGQSEVAYLDTLSELLVAGPARTNGTQNGVSGCLGLILWSWYSGGNGGEGECEGGDEEGVGEEHGGLVIGVIGFLSEES